MFEDIPSLDSDILSHGNIVENLVKKNTASKFKCLNNSRIKNLKENMSEQQGTRHGVNQEQIIFNQNGGLGTKSSIIVYDIKKDEQDNSGYKQTKRRSRSEEQVFDTEEQIMVNRVRSISI